MCIIPENLVNNHNNSKNVRKGEAQMAKYFSVDRPAKAAYFLLIALFIFGVGMGVYIHTDRELSDVAGKIVRLHVVANSDSPEDQALKLEIRDAVIQAMSPKFEELNRVEDVRAVIRENLDEIEQLALDTMEKQGKAYSVAASLGQSEFPTKVYGNLTLPAGTYQALNIVIGNGGGKNWWCVMFPPLCFIDVAHGVIPEETMEELRKTLTEEEYKLLTSAETEGEIPVKLRFKIVEMAKSFNQKIAQIGKGK